MKLERKAPGSSGEPAPAKASPPVAGPSATGYATALLNDEGRIVAFSAPGGEFCGHRPGEIPGEHWSVLCADSDLERLAALISKGPGHQHVNELYVGLTGGGPPIRVARLRHERLRRGGHSLTFLRISTDAFPPLDSAELRTLLGHSFHSLRSPLTSLSTAIQLLAGSTKEVTQSRRRRLCGQAQGNLSLLERTLAESSLVLEDILEFSTEEAASTDIIGFLTGIGRDLAGGDAISIIGDPASSGGAAANGKILLRQRCLRHLILQLFGLCEKFGTLENGIAVRVSFESRLLRIRFSSPGMSVPEAVAAVLRAPLRLHDSGHRQSAFFFDGFVIGQHLRALGGTLKVSAADSGDSEITLKLPIAAGRHP